MTEIEAIEQRIKALREQDEKNLTDSKNQHLYATNLAYVAEFETKQAEVLEKAKEKLESQSAKEKKN